MQKNVSDMTDSELAKLVLTSLNWEVKVVKQSVPVGLDDDPYGSQDNYEDVDLLGLYNPENDLVFGPSIDEYDLWKMVSLYGVVYREIVKDIQQDGQITMIMDKDGVTALIDVVIPSEDGSESVTAQSTAHNPDTTRFGRTVAEAWCEIAGINES